MINLAICDDEAAARAILCDYIHKFAEESGETIAITQFSSGEQLLDNYPVNDHGYAEQH